MANVTSKVTQIRNAVLGIDVREGIAGGIEDINTEVISTTLKETVLEGQFNSLVINAGTNNGEVVAGRTSAVTGLTSDTVGHRIDGVDSSLANKAQQVDLTNGLALKRSIATKLELEDASATFLGAITGTGTFNLLSIPQDLSVDKSKVIGLVNKIGINLFDKATMIETDKGITNIGNIQPIANWNIAIIPVKALTNYSFRHYDNYYGIADVGALAYMDIDKVILSFIDMSTLIADVNGLGKTLTTPTNTAYICKNIKVGGLNWADTFQFQIGNTITFYEPYNEVLEQLFNVKLSDTKARADIEILNSAMGVNPKWSNKNWYVIGDSMTEHNARTSKNYHDYITDKISCLVTNYGIGGTGYTCGGVNAIYNRIVGLGTNAELITVFAGANDFLNPFVMGQLGDAETVSLIGAIESTIKKLIAKFPTKTIAVFTPIPYGDTLNPTNQSGYTQLQISDAIINVCNHYSIPVLDLQRNSGLFPWNTTSNDYYFKAIGTPSGDCLHPNDAGHMLLADKILSFLEKL